MKEDTFNIEVRKFLKEVGVTSQREIESAVRSALEAGRIEGDEKLKAVARIQIECTRVGSRARGVALSGPPARLGPETTFAGVSLDRLSASTRYGIDSGVPTTCTGHPGPEGATRSPTADGINAAFETSGRGAV